MSWGHEGAGVELGLGYLSSTHCSPDFCLLQTPPWNSRPVYNCLPELSKGDSRPLCHSGQRRGHTRHLSPSLLPPNPQGMPYAESAHFPPPPATALVWPPILACLNLLLHCLTPSRSFLLDLRGEKRKEKKKKSKSYRVLCNCRIPAACLVSPASPPLSPSPTPAPAPASSLALTHGGSLLPQGLCTCLLPHLLLSGGYLAFPFPPI